MQSLAILEQDAGMSEAGDNGVGCADEGGASIANDALRASAMAPGNRSIQSSAASYGNFKGNKNLIEFQNVSKYYGERRVLAAINLHISAGEKIALVGESGAGKTTLLNLLLGFEAATEGNVLLNGLAVNRESATQEIAWVGQNPYIFHGTIKDNIALADPDAV